jgi:hypothetical protein
LEWWSHKSTALSAGISSLSDEFKHPSTIDTIPPQTKKRKAAEAIVSSDKLSATRSSKRIASAAVKEGPPTPLTTASPMDSEDDFMSGMSSDDDMLQESDNEDGSADGMFISSASPFVPTVY